MSYFSFYTLSISVDVLKDDPRSLCAVYVMLACLGMNVCVSVYAWVCVMCGVRECVCMCIY